MIWNWGTTPASFFFLAAPSVINPFIKMHIAKLFSVPAFPPLWFLTLTLFCMLLLKSPFLRGFHVGSNTPAKRIPSPPTPVELWYAQGRLGNFYLPWIWVGTICRKWMQVFFPHLGKGSTTIICMIVMSRLICF